MKKITTILMMLLVVTFGFSQQEVVQDFEASPTVEGFEGLASATIVDDPSSAGNGKVYELVTATGGNAWQGAFVELSSDSSLDLTSDKSIDVDIWSDVAFSPMLKVESSESAAAAANTQSHTGSGWETLTFTFDTGSDNTSTADGTYTKISFFPNRNAADDNWRDPIIDGTFYFDNIKGVKTSIGFAQAELVTNGDFETGTLNPWTGDGSIITQGTNSIYEADVQAAGNPWDVNISQVIPLDDGKTYELSFDAFTDTNTGSRTIIAGLGQNGGTYNSVNEEVTITSTSQTFTYQFTINYGDAEDDRVLFDMGAEVGFVFIDNVSVIEVQSTCNNGTQDGDETGVDCGGSCAPCGTPPATAAPTPPARDAAEVFSVYSNAYTNEQSTLEAYVGDLKNFDIGGNDFVRLSGPPGANLQWFFGIPDGVDLSSFTHYHMDFYFEGDVPGEGAIFQTIIQGFDSDSNFTGNTLHNVIPTDTGSWISLDIPIETFSGKKSVRDNIGQMQLTMAGPQFGPTYVDNVYFHKNTTLSNTDFAQAEFKAYPNPARAAWTIQTTEDMKAVQVYNIAGSLVRDLEVNSSKTVISTEGLSSGVYLAKISNGLDQTKTIKLIKE